MLPSLTSGIGHRRFNGEKSGTFPLLASPTTTSCYNAIWTHETELSQEESISKCDYLWSGRRVIV